MQLFRRGDIWYVSYYEQTAQGKRRIKRTTNCTDKKAAEALGRQWERDASDPTLARTRDVTLEAVLTSLVQHRTERAKAGAGSADTAAFYAAKAGPLLREIGAHFAVASLDANVIDAYISTRRSQWADDKQTRKVTDHTITKELVALRAALKLAKRRGQWRGDVDAVIPRASELSPQYEPRIRHLSPEEAMLLLSALTTPNHHAVVAFILATGAEWRTVQLARRVDVDLAAGQVLLRGTKSKQRFRKVPIVTDWQRALLSRALEHAEGEDGLLFARWSNVRHGLHAACKAAGCARANCPKLRVCGRGACRDPEHRSYTLTLISPHDLRRSFATWLRASGLPVDVLAAVLGHKDGRMVERVYARLDPAALAARMRAALGGTPVGQTQWTEADLVDDLDAQVVPGTSVLSENSVPRDGIEPPTRGFSVPALGSKAPRRRRDKRTHTDNRGTPVGQKRERTG